MLPLLSKDDGTCKFFATEYKKDFIRVIKIKLVHLLKLYKYYTGNFCSINFYDTLSVLELLQTNSNLINSFKFLNTTSVNLRFNKFISLYLYVI